MEKVPFKNFPSVNCRVYFYLFSKNLLWQKFQETNEFSILQIVGMTFKGSELGLLVNDKRMNYAKS